MIRNDAELAAEQEALGRIERALQSLRERVYPKNPGNFAIYAEAYIDEINKLKTEIDEYLAGKQARAAPTTTTPAQSAPDTTSIS